MNALIVVENAVSIAPPIEQAITIALGKSALIGGVKTAAHQSKAVEAIREMKGIQKQIEDARKKVKEPVLDLCRSIDKAAADARTEIDSEVLRLDSAISEFQQAEKIKAQELERERQRELDRIEQEKREAEFQARQKAEAEEQERRKAARKLQEEAEAAERAERDRIEASEAIARDIERRAAAARTNKAKEEAERQRQALAQQQAKAEAESKAAAEARRVEMERLQAEQEAAKVQQAEAFRLAAERAAQAGEALGGPIVATTAKGQTSRDQFDYEVVDIQLLYRVNPGLCKPLEANRSEILNLINAVGVKEIKGLRIIPVIKNTIRAGKAIDV